MSGSLLSLCYAEQSQGFSYCNKRNASRRNICGMIA
jgi:hypothetical protein